MELVRYIHLNPLRANLASNLAELNRYPQSGNSTLIITQQAISRLAQIGEKPPIEKNLLLENRENNKIIWPSHSPIRSFSDL